MRSFFVFQYPVVLNILTYFDILRPRFLVLTSAIFVEILRPRHPLFFDKRPYFMGQTYGFPQRFPYRVIFAIFKRTLRKN